MPLHRQASRHAGSVGSPSGPGNGGDVFRYRLHSPDGDDLGEATYAMMIHPGEEIIAGHNQRFRVLAVVPFVEDESPFEIWRWFRGRT